VSSSITVGVFYSHTIALVFHKYICFKLFCVKQIDHTCDVRNYNRLCNMVNPTIKMVTFLFEYVFVLLKIYKFTQWIFLRCRSIFLEVSIFFLSYTIEQ
jgi:hypothetical protein